MNELGRDNKKFSTRKAFEQSLFQKNKEEQMLEWTTD
jgi:hypothetical protein